MKDVNMDIRWRAIQLFLGDEGISEVSVAEENSKKVRCTCAVFSSSGKCKHAKFVKDKIAENNGNYVVQIPVDVPDEDGIEAMRDTDSWREFLYKYSKVEVID